jgi:hypothetical protein
MKSLLRGSLAAGVAIAGLGLAAPASAATTDSADVQAQILTALSVVAVTGDDVLDFGTIADGGITANANLTVTPAGALVSCPASLICGGTTNAPTFNVSGLANKLVGISFVNSTETLNYVGTAPTGFGATTLQAGTFTTSANSNQVTLNGSGAASFTVGGTLTVQPDTAPGTYQGTVTVKVVYN